MKVLLWLLSVTAFTAFLGNTEAQLQNELSPGLGQEDGDLINVANKTTRGQRSELALELYFTQLSLFI